MMASSSHKPSDHGQQGYRKLNESTCNMNKPGKLASPRTTPKGFPAQIVLHFLGQIDLSLTPDLFGAISGEQAQQIGPLCHKAVRISCLLPIPKKVFEVEVVGRYAPSLSNKNICGVDSGGITGIEGLLVKYSS